MAGRGASAQDDIPVVTPSSRGGQNFSVFTCACDVCSLHVCHSVRGYPRVCEFLGGPWLDVGRRRSLPADGAHLRVLASAARPAVPFQGIPDEQPYWLRLSVGAGAQRSAFILWWEAPH